MGFSHVASVIFLTLKRTESPRVVFSQSIVSSVTTQTQPLSPSHPSRPILCPLPPVRGFTPFSSHESSSKRAALVSFSSRSPDTAPCRWFCLPTSCHTVGTSHLHRLAAPDICSIASFWSTLGLHPLPKPKLSFQKRRRHRIAPQPPAMAAYAGVFPAFSHPKEHNALQAE